MLMSRPSQQQDDTYKEQHYLGCWKQVVDNYSNTFLDYDCYMNTTMHSIVCGYTRCWLRMIEMGMIEDTFGMVNLVYKNYGVYISFQFLFYFILIWSKLAMLWSKPEKIGGHNNKKRN